ncbi:hypothetical protein [Massilia rubra]|uniref:HEAT repeat domain-containing protein n=1 Tax=Massilia rubra TaxID=2607910 RepID=A0ABX0LXY2_9BURK|nr:hypothetical protein [Massilia rubra]NHZ34926.1 hypothetical protein [Massilia rubra]
MDKSQRTLLDTIRANLSERHQLAGIDADSLKNYILGEMQTDIASDEDNWMSLDGMIGCIKDEHVKAYILNNLLIMPGHYHHQEITRKIQHLGHPSSIPCIRTMLENGFDTLQYTCSEDEVIAKWFSHALADIGTPASIALIREFASSPNEGIAAEMRYRLEQLGIS